MSEENVEIIREAIEHWNEGDLDAVAMRMNPEGVIHPFPEWPDDSIYHGRDGWRKLIGQWLENFDEIRWDIGRLIDSDDRVVALIEHHAKIKGTGVGMSQPLGALFERFSGDGTVGSASFFLTWKEALEAAGLSE